jgi:hypothetical protein
VELALAVVVILTTSNLTAPTNYGMLNEAVTDAQGHAVVGTEVTIKDSALGETLNAITNSAGEYLVSAVDPGAFDISAQAVGFGVHRRKDAPAAMQHAHQLSCCIRFGPGALVLPEPATQFVVFSARLLFQSNPNSNSDKQHA